MPKKNNKEKSPSSEENPEKETELKNKVDWVYIFIAFVVVGVGAIRDKKLVSYWEFVSFAGATWFWFSLLGKVFFKGTMGVAAYICGLQTIVFVSYAYSINSTKLGLFVLGFSLFFPCLYLLLMFVLDSLGWITRKK